MAKIFNSVPATKISRSRHNLSHQVKASFDPGRLTPLMTELARPGDTWKCSLEQFVRTMPMIAPVMDMVDIKVDAFFVPIRLIWDDFENFITLGLTGEFEAAPPTISIDAYTPSSASYAASLNQIFGVGGSADYLNFPSLPYTNGVAHDEVQFDALPFRAYQFIYNEYYLNENLDSPIPLVLSSGNTKLSLDPNKEGTVTNFYLQNRGWRKDYFTSALPLPQKGPAVKIPYSDIEINISDDGQLKFKASSENNPFASTDVDEDLPLRAEVFQDFSGKYGKLNAHNSDTSHTVNLAYLSGLKAESAAIRPPTIEELRYAEVLQEFYEANARGGTRPKEYYLNIWHTRSKDSRLDRPEYLGGYRGPLTISDIDQTSQSATTAQGTLAGKGVSAGGQKLFSYHVPEWGIIMVIMSVQPKTAYYQGYRRWNLYKDAFDWPNPFFANLGEQVIYNKEIYTDSSDGYDDDIFGYTPRYSECKFIPDSVHGQFRSSLDYWHLARKFGSRPNLNSAFVHVQPSELARIFPSQVTSMDKLVGTFFFHITCKMYLPYWGVPRLLHSI